MKTPDPKKTPAGRRRSVDYRRRVEELKIRLAEAEETLSAIRRGLVDAVVVDAPKGERIYTLMGADRAYRVFLEVMREGALTVTAGGLILYANRRFAEIAGRPLEKVIGESIFAFAAPEDRRALDTLLTAGTSGGSRGEVSLRCDERKSVAAIVSASPLPGSDPPALCLVIADLTEQKKVEAELLRHRNHLADLVSERTAEADEKGRILDALMEHIPEGITIADAPDARIRMVSRYGREVLGGPAAGAPADDASRWTVYEKDGVSPVSPEDRPLTRAVTRGEVVKNREIVEVDGQGQRVPMLYNAGPIRDGSGKVVGGVVAWRDITDLKQMEGSLKSALDEKDLLMRELAHRTKNNMQVIDGLLTLQAAVSADRNFVSAVADTQERIRAMALIHEKLYRSDRFDVLNIKGYIEELLASILRSYRGRGGRVTTKLNLEDISMSIDAALPCGLIMNELVSNSLKHAFAGGRSGSIFVALRCVGDTVELRYRDDGPGLPRDIDLSTIKSLGLKLVYNLAVRQLHGTMEIRQESRCEFVFTFPLGACGEKARR